MSIELTQENILNLILTISVPLLFVIVPIYLFSLFRLFKEMKTKEQDLWASLGSPTLIMNNSLSNNYLVCKWLVKKDYKNSTNEIIFKLGKKSRLLLISGLLLTLISFASFLYLAAYVLPANGKTPNNQINREQLELRPENRPPLMSPRY